MNIVDIIIIVALILGALVGFARGFFKQTIVFLGTILVVVLSFALKNPLAQIMYRNFPFLKLGGLTALNIVVYEIAAFIVSITLLSFLLSIVIKVTGIIETALKATVVFAVPSKMLGMVVGVIQSIVIMYVVLFIASLPVLKVPYIDDSIYAKIILTKTPIISNITKNTVNNFKEISEFTKSEINLKDIKKTNSQIVNILIKNKIITAENIKVLIDNGKIVVDDSYILNEVE